MNDSVITDLSLLRRVGLKDKLAWDDFASLYGPLVYHWARTEGLQPEDARDICQEVFKSVLSALERWEPGRFRSWLWTIFRRRVMDHYRRVTSEPAAVGGSTAMQQIQDIAEDPPELSSSQGNQELLALRSRALEMIQEKVDPVHWQAFQRTAIRGDNPSDVAEDLGISKWAVYKAKSRVHMKLAREFEELGFAWQGHATNQFKQTTP